MSLRKGLVAHYTMSQDSLKGSLLGDKTPYENDGTIYGATFATDRKGQANKCMYFDGVDDYVDCGNADILSAPSNLTVEAWFMTNTVTLAYQQIVGKQSFLNEYRLILYNNNLAGQIYSSSREYSIHSNKSGVTIVAGNWYHAVMTYDKQNFRLYVNGIQVDVLPLSITIAPNSYRLRIGRNSSAAYYFNGLIDDVRIYNRALSQEEITLLYNSYNPKIIL